MIVGIDSALATCGWSVVDPATCRVVDFGVFTTTKEPGVAKSTDFARRAAFVAEEVRSLVASHNATTIAAEQALFFGTTNAVVPQVIAWGAIVGVAVAAGVELVEVVSKEWQRSVLGRAPNAPGPVCYDDVAAELALIAGARLHRIPKGLRSHALDAIGVGLFARFHPTTKVVHR